MWDEKLSDLRTKIAKNWDPKRTDDQQSFKSKLSLTRVLILVPDPSASDETGDEEKVKKKQKTMSSKRKETTRVNIPALKGRFFAIFQVAFIVTVSDKGGFTAGTQG